MFDSNQNNMYGGYSYNPMNGQPINVRQDSTLTKEEYDNLMKHANPFNLTLTEQERTRGICNHRSFDGAHDMLVEEADGTMRCTVCGYRFNPVADMTREDIEDACGIVTDILQTVKLLYIDMPIQTQREYFQIIPLIDKIPQLFDMAAQNFSKHENTNRWGWQGNNMNTMNMFNTLSGIFGGGANGYNQQPGYSWSAQPNPAMQNQGYMNQPQQPYQQGYPNAPVGSTPPSNGFGYMGSGPMQNPYVNNQQYNNPYGQQPYAPQNTGFQYTPNQGQQPMPQNNPQQYTMNNVPPTQPGTQAPTDTKAQTDGNTVNATATFTS